MREKTLLLQFKVWKTIVVGTYATREEYRKMLASNHYNFSIVAYDIMGKTSFLKERQNVELFKATVGDLGFTTAPTYEEICNKLTQLGYKKCLNDVGPALRLEYGEQPVNDEVLIIMRPELTLTHRGVPFVFHLFLDDKGAYLSDYRAYPDDTIPIGKSIIFCR